MVRGRRVSRDALVVIRVRCGPSVYPVHLFRAGVLEKMVAYRNHHMVVPEPQNRHCLAERCRFGPKSTRCGLLIRSVCARLPSPPLFVPCPMLLSPVLSDFPPYLTRVFLLSAPRFPLYVCVVILDAASPRSLSGLSSRILQPPFLKAILSPSGQKRKRDEKCGASKFHASAGLGPPRWYHTTYGPRNGLGTNCLGQVQT